MRSFVAAVLLLGSSVAHADATVDTTKFFADSSMRLGGDATAGNFLAAAGQWLKQDRSRTVRVEVHANDRLLRADNQVLAHGRAKALAKALQREGAAKKQILLVAIGHEAVQRLPETRRVVFDFSDDAAPVVWPAGK